VGQGRGGRRDEAVEFSPFCDEVVGHVEDFEAGELLDAGELVDEVVGDPELLKRIANVVKAFDLFDLVSADGEDLEAVCGGGEETERESNPCPSGRKSCRWNWMTERDACMLSKCQELGPSS
jgi:hypothetical protein